MKWHLPTYLAENVRRFGNVSVLDASHFEQYTVHTRRAYQRMSRRPAIRI